MTMKHQAEHDNPPACASRAGCPDHHHCWFCGVIIPDIGECSACLANGCSLRALLVPIPAQTELDAERDQQIADEELLFDLGRGGVL